MSGRHKSSGYNSRDARKYWTARLPLPCSRCGVVVDGRSPWDVDHVYGLAAGGPANDPQTQWPAHASCNRRAGQQVGQQTVRSRKNADRRTNFLDL